MSLIKLVFSACVRRLCPASTPLPWLPVTVGALWLFVVLAESHGTKVVPRFPAGQEANIYSAICSATGSLLGFVITAATIFLTLPVEEHLKRFANNGMLCPLFGTFLRAIMMSTVALVASLTGLLAPSFTLEYITLMAVSFALAFLMQSVRILATVGESVLGKIEDDAKKAKEANRKAIQDQMGPRGST
jgi:hypothetical protein